MEKYTKEQLEELCKNSYSYAEVLKKAGRKPAGGSYNNLKKKIEEFGIDISHFTGQAWNKNNFDYSRFRYGVAIKSANLKDALVELRGYKCECCGNSNWLSKLITLEVHHKDGDPLNNELENLKLLCPNCHSYTENWRNKNNTQEIKREYISDDKFAQALKESSSIRQALIKLGLSPKGGNYTRANEIIAKYNIQMK